MEQVEIFLERAKVSLEDGDFKKAYLNADFALQLFPSCSQALLFKMKATGNIFNIQDFNISEVVELGEKVIETDSSKSKEVYMFFLNKIFMCMDLCIHKIHETNQAVQTIYQIQYGINSANAGEKTLEEDTIIKGITSQIPYIRKLRKHIPNSIVSADADICHIAEVVSRMWIVMTEAIINRYAIYSMELSDEAITEFRAILSDLKAGLPADLSNSIKDQEISNKSKGHCYVATSVYGSYDCPEVWTLRRFRDNILALSWQGRLFIQMYYMISPYLVELFGRTKWFRYICKRYLDKFVRYLHNKGVKSTPYMD